MYYSTKICIFQQKNKCLLKKKKKKLNTSLPETPDLMSCTCTQTRVSYGPSTKRWQPKIKHVFASNLRCIRQAHVMQGSRQRFGYKAKACPDGGESKERWIMASLALTLCWSLAIKPKEKIKLPLSIWEIIMKPNNDDNNRRKIQMTERIMRIIAKDKTKDKILRMVYMNTAVYKYASKIRRNEVLHNTIQKSGTLPRLDRNSWSISWLHKN